MSTSKGVVGKITSREFNGKKAYSFVLKNESTWYSAGWNAPTFKEGDSIQFDIVQRGSYLDAKNITPWTDGVADQGADVRSIVKSVPSSFYKKPFAAGKSAEEKEYWANKDLKQEETQRRIEIQAARNAAIETTKLLLEHGLISVPEKVKKTEGKSYLDALINELVDEYINNTSTRLGGAAAPPAIEVSHNESADTVNWS